MEAGQTAGTLALLGTVFVLNPDAAIGAAAGAMFFMLHQNHRKPAYRAIYTLISMLAGYSVGHGYGDSWSMFAALCGGAGAVVFLTATLDRLQAGESGPLVQFFIDLLRGRK